MLFIPFPTKTRFQLQNALLPNIEGLVFADLLIQKFLIAAKQLTSDFQKCFKKEAWRLNVLSKMLTMVWAKWFSLASQTSKPTKDHYFAVSLRGVPVWSTCEWSQILSLTREELWRTGLFVETSLHHSCQLCFLQSCLQSIIFFFLEVPSKIVVCVCVFSVHTK